MSMNVADLDELERRWRSVRPKTSVDGASLSGHRAVRHLRPGAIYIDAGRHDAAVGRRRPLSSVPVKASLVRARREDGMRRGAGPSAATPVSTPRGAH